MAAPVTPSYLTWKTLIKRQWAPRSPSSAVTSDPKLITKMEATRGCQVCVSVSGAPMAPLLLFGASVSHTVCLPNSQLYSEELHVLCSGESDANF